MLRAGLNEGARTYSWGNRRKAALVATFLSDVHTFTELTSALDPLMEAVFTEPVRDARAAGRTALLSSHILSRVGKVRDTVTIVGSGRVPKSCTSAAPRHLSRTTVSALVARPPGGIDGCAGVPRLHRVGQRCRHARGVFGRQPRDRLRAGELAGSGCAAAPPSLRGLLIGRYSTSADAPAGRDVVAVAR